MKIEMRATPGRGLPHVKEKENVVGTPTREKENVAGTPAKEKEYVAGTPAIEWWYGGDSHKKRAGIPANVRGWEFDKQTWKRGKNWYYTVNYTGKTNSVTNSVVIWNFEFVLLLRFLRYTDSYMGRVDRVLNRVLAWKC